MKQEQDKYLEYLEGTLDLLELALQNVDSKGNNKIVNLKKEDIIKNIADVKNKIQEYKQSLEE